MLTRISEFIGRLRGVSGVIDVRLMSREKVQEIVEIEDSIVSVSCGLRMENSGVGTCASKEFVFAMLCSSDFPRPSEITMEMVDDDGTVVGHDVPPCLMEEFGERKDVIWIADTFIMYPSKVTAKDARMVLHASRLKDARLPNDLAPWLFYPSVSSALKLNDELGFEGNGRSTILLGVDGLEFDSVPVTEMVQITCGGGGHCEPTSEHTFDRCHFIGE